MHVTKPWGDSAQYDFILEHQSRFLRVQVKSTQFFDHGCYPCAVRGSRWRYAENAFDFPEVAQLFRVITSDTRTVLVNHDIEKRLKNRTASERPDWKQIMENSVQVWSNRLPFLPFRPLPGLEDILVIQENCYDDFLGYMKGVLPLLRAQADGGLILL